MNKNTGAVFVLILVVLGSHLADLANAGPLDRAPSGARRNPAADNMIRIPGVIGFSFSAAMGILQQAGLSPEIEIMKKENKKYKGMEGKVVQQVPSPGGVAMIGSSVKVTFYMSAEPKESEYGGSYDPTPYPDRGRGYQQPYPGREEGYSSPQQGGGGYPSPSPGRGGDYSSPYPGGDGGGGYPSPSPGGDGYDSSQYPGDSGGFPNPSSGGRRDY
jgi:hypothetical protein